MTELTLRRLIEDENKVVSDYGAWLSGAVPSSKFPIRKQKRLRYSPAWSWRCIHLQMLGYGATVLLTLNEEIQQFNARLGLHDGDDLKVICTYDLHVTHKNWHCHFVTGDVKKTSPGYLRDRENTVYFPSGGMEVPCTVEFNVTKRNAVNIAARRFRFPEPAQSELDV